MTKPVRLEVEAEAELWEIAERYGSEDPQLGNRFLDRARQRLEQVQRWPHAAPLIQGLPEDLEVRRARIQGFPYLVVYLDLPQEVFVIAIAHESREPGYWQERL